jgi:transcription initiation factor TFIIIB Brf1 subunit/transcription initiation factor TFIIB
MSSKDEDFDYIWKEMDSIKSCNKNIIKEELNTYITFCKMCESTNIRVYDNIICGDCGLVLFENRISETAIFSGEKSEINYVSTKSNRISKIKEWNNWTKDEKNTYKLKEYIKTLCQRLNIIESMISNIIETSIIVMNSIKKNDGTKRGRVKDGIVITCIHHISKSTLTPYCYIYLANKIDIDIKYITRAEKLISELVNMNILHFKEFTEMKKINPYDYIVSTIKKNNISNISNNILKKVKLLIEICEDNDILQDHTPLSIGCSCFYYILNMEKDINIDIKTFSFIYNISIVTLVKTYNKLLLYKDKINKLLEN